MRMTLTELLVLTAEDAVCGVNRRYDHKLFTLCVCMCFFTLDFWAKARPQTMH